MTVSTKGRYALRMIVDLAQHAGEGAVTLKAIAERQQISKKYLEQIVLSLNGSDVLISNRGFGGGYMLGKPANEITVGEILRHTEGSLAPVPCVAQKQCDRADKCSTISLWRGLNKVVNEYLDSVTIADLANQNCNF